MSNKKTSSKLAIQIAKIRRFFFIRKVMKLRRKADAIREKTGIQQFVIKYDENIRILGRDQWKWMKQKGIVAQNYTIDNLRAIALYCTKK